MAKRVRGGTTRPGQRRPLQRSRTSATRPPTASASIGSSAATAATPTAQPAPKPATLTDEEEARAAELEAQIVAEEKRTTDAQKRSRERTAGAMVAPVGAPGRLAASSAEEYAYVARDVRRISIVGGSLIGVLLLLWVLTVAGVIKF